MRLIFSPVRMDTALTATIAGDELTLNGVALDFGPLPAGGILPRAAIDSPWIGGDVTRDATGLVSVPLILPHGASAPAETLWPVPIEAGDGPVPLPPFDAPTVTELPDDEN